MCQHNWVTSGTNNCVSTLMWKFHHKFVSWCWGAWWKWGVKLMRNKWRWKIPREKFGGNIEAKNFWAGAGRMGRPPMKQINFASNWSEIVQPSRTTSGWIWNHSWAIWYRLRYVHVTDLVRNPYRALSTRIGAVRYLFWLLAFSLLIFNLLVILILSITSID